MISFRFTGTFIALLLFCGFFAVKPTHAIGMPGFDPYNQKMSSALQLESKAYLSYKEFTGHIANYDEQQIYDEYARYSKVWREDLKGAQEVYSPYTKDISGRPVRKISQFTIEGNNKALEAINIYAVSYTHLYSTLFPKSPSLNSFILLKRTSAFLSSDSCVYQTNGTPDQMFPLAVLVLSSFSSLPNP